MNFSREVARQTSCYTYVIEEEDPALASLNVFEVRLSPSPMKKNKTKEKNYSITVCVTIQFAEKGDLALLENLVKKSPEVLNEKDENGASPLHYAAAGGYISLIHFITSLIGPQGRPQSSITICNPVRLMCIVNCLNSVLKLLYNTV